MFKDLSKLSDIKDKKGQNMPKNNFDSEKFAKALAKKAFKIVPKGLSKEEISFVVNKVYQFAILCANALKLEKKFSDYQISIIMQYIADWTFIKAVDSIRAKIPHGHEEILKEVSYNIFQEAKKCIENNVTETLFNFRIKVIAEDIYKKAIERSIKNGIIDKRQSEFIEYEDSSKRYEDIHSSFSTVKYKQSLIKKIILNPVIQYLIHLSFLIKVVFIGFTELFLPIFSIWLILSICFLFLFSHITYPELLKISLISIVIGAGYRGTINYCKKYNVKKSLEKLENAKNKLNENIHPYLIYEKLKIAILEIRVGEKLIEIADPNKKDILMPKIVALRKKLIEKYGYMIPLVRVLDDSTLNSYEYCISIREKVYGKDIIYPYRSMVQANIWDATNKPLPIDTITGINPVNKTKVYWFNPEEAPYYNIIKFQEPCDVITEHLENICINHCDEIFTLEDVQKLLDNLNKQTTVYTDNLVPSLISITDLRKILVNLVSKRISVKYLAFILENLCDYARFTKDTDALTEKIIAILLKNQTTEPVTIENPTK